MFSDRTEPDVGLPPSTPEGAIFGCLLMELEKLHPGLVEACLARAADDAHRIEVVRLRGPKTDALVRKNLGHAHAYFAMASVVAKHVGPSVKKWKFWPPR